MVENRPQVASSIRGDTLLLRRIFAPTWRVALQSEDNRPSQRPIANASKRPYMAEQGSSSSAGNVLCSFQISALAATGELRSAQSNFVGAMHLNASAGKFRCLMTSPAFASFICVVFATVVRLSDARGAKQNDRFKAS